MQKHLLFKGHVQGVGFRYTTKKLAEVHQLNGWVRNLGNGDVELMIDGEKQHYDGFKRALSAHFKGYIDQCVEQDVEDKPYHHFEIR